MNNVEHLARTVAEQRTGDPERWSEFTSEVEKAIEKVKRVPDSYPRDFLDEPEWGRQP